MLQRMQFQDKKYNKPPNPIFQERKVAAPPIRVRSALPLSLVLAAPSASCGSCSGAK